MFKQFIVIAAASTLAAKLAQHLSHQRRQRHAHAEKRQHHDDVKRWEAEGGNLPVQPKTR